MRLFIQLLLVLSTLSCSHVKKAGAAGWDVTIKGKVKFPQEGVIQIQEATSSTAITPQPIELQKDNTFSKTLHLTEPGVFSINFYDKQIVYVIVDRTNFELNVDGNSQQGAAEVIGSPDHDLYKKVRLMFQEIQESPVVKTLNAEFEKANAAKDDKKMEEIHDQYDKHMENGKDKIAAFLNQQPPSLALCKLLQEPNVINPEKNLSVLISAVAKFQQRWPTYSCTKELTAVVDKLKVVGLGQVAPEIALPNPEGKIIKLSSLRGKYVLVDFWASWCGPCRQENPNVVKAYHQFHSKGFEVYSVSLDRDGNKEDWLRAIKQDGLVWTQVSDLKYWQSQAAKDYNVTAIPFSFLLDKNGVILAKNLRGTKLEKKLEELLGK